MEFVFDNCIEFVNAVANDCILNMNEKMKKTLMDNPYITDWHFTYGMYIRNRYIYDNEIANEYDPDDLSSGILKTIFSKLLPDYVLENAFIEMLYDDKSFIKLRREYKIIYGYYPEKFVTDYAKKVVLEPVHPCEEWCSPEVDYETELANISKNFEICHNAVQQFNKELAELVWRTDLLKKTAFECGIDYEKIAEKVENIKELFYKVHLYIPIEVCLLPYKNQIGRERYIAYRRTLSRQLKENPWLVEELDKEYFYDRVLARTALKYSQTLEELTMYQDDDAMVKYALKHNGEAIQYASKRFQEDREWVRYAIEHSQKGTVMFWDCMEPYRKDKEMVYLACKIERWNLVYVDEAYRDDLELAKICLEQRHNPNRIFSFLSKRLQDNKELVLLDLEGYYPETDCYSKRLQDDDEVAAKLYELHGPEAWSWDHMSERLRGKYNIC